MTSSNTNLTGLDYVEKSGSALLAAQTLAQGVVAEQEKIASVVESRVDFLQESNLIKMEEKDAAAEQLSQHSGALDMVGSLIQINMEQKQAADKRIAELTRKLAAAGLGEGDAYGQKAASAGNGRSSDNLEDGGYVGQRAGSQEVRASDMPLMKAAGLA